MNIQGFDCFAVKNTVSPRTGVSILYVDTHSFVVVKLTDKDGLSGWGETNNAPGILSAVETVAGSLVGRDDSLRTMLDAVRFSAGGLAGGGFAASALSIALEDLRARQLGISIAEMYGGPVRTDARVYAASGGYTEGVHPSESWPAEVQRALEGGYTALKLRVGGYPIATEAKLLEEVASTVPVGFDLMVDGNAGYVMPQAVQMGTILGELGFRWFEEPLVQHGGYIGYPELTHRLPIAIAAGEATVSVRSAQHFLTTRSADIIQPDPVICGGVGAAILISEIAALNGIMSIPHCANSAIGITASLHALACIPNATRSFVSLEPLLEFGIDGSVWRTELLAQPHVMKDGRIPIPSGPGLGIEVDESHIRSVAIAHTSSAT
jgi:D-galactarolactone cycloisomerase